MRLVTPIKFDENVQPACQPRVGNFVGHKSQTSGWGTLKWGSSLFPGELQWTQLKVVDSKRCEYRLQQVYSMWHVTENMLCAGFKGHTSRDTCQGDSGGPLTVKRSDGRFEILGVVSWGYK